MVNCAALESRSQPLARLHHEDSSRLPATQERTADTPLGRGWKLTHNLITPALGAVETRKTIMRFRFEVRSGCLPRQRIRADQPERPFKGRQHSGEVILSAVR